MLRGRSNNRLGTAAILSVLVAYVSLVQGPGWNQNAHYALIRALSDGTAEIDQTRQETGTWYVTGDVTFFRNHYYAAKAPGLAFASLPVYAPMKASGAWNSGESTPMLWFLGLWTVILPAAVMLFLVRQIADRLQPGAGTIAAITLGVGTLVLPFSTLFFAHLLSAALGFAAFAVLWHERAAGSTRLGRLGAAGLLAGLAVTAEYPLAIVTLVLGLYAVSRRPVVDRGLAYAAGAFAGVLPLFLYQWWAFGSPAHFAYSGGLVGVGYNREGLLGLQLPSFRVAMELLFSTTGLLRLAPVLALASIGTAMLYRRGWRAEALVIAAVAVAFLVYDSGYEVPFGGRSPGPRFLIPVLPFLVLGLAAFLAERPLTTLALAAPSVVLMATVTITHPMSNWDGHWFERIHDGDFSATVLGLFGRMPLDSMKLPSSAHWYPLLLFLVPLGVALALAVTTRPRLGFLREDALSAIACFVGWLVVQQQAPRFLSGQGVGRGVAPFVVLLLAAAVAVFAVALPAVFRAREAPLGEGA